MAEDFLLISVLSIFFGISLKIADGHNEHGLDFFPGAGVLFGCISGLLVFYLVDFSANLQGGYLGLLLYWLYKRKIDCVPHLIMTIMLLAGVFFTKDAWSFPAYQMLGVFSGYLIFDYIKHHHQKSLPNNFFRNKLHFHAIHLIYSIVTMDIYVYSRLVFELLGTYLADRIFSIPRVIVLPKAKQKY